MANNEKGKNIDSMLQRRKSNSITKPINYDNNENDVVCCFMFMHFMYIYGGLL